MKKKISEQLNKYIPGGCHTYSKGDNQFPTNAPEAILRGKGCYVVGSNNIKYLDCGMGLSSVSVGHANKEINDYVKKQLDKGTNFSRPSILELKVAKEFLKLVPRHQMIKFAKNGSTITSAAVKLARAYTGREYVAYPKEHYFYSYDDWFISKQKPKAGTLRDTAKKTLTFSQCNLKSLEDLFIKYKGKIACVIMEPEKNYCNVSCNCKIKVSEYLKKAQKIIKDNGALFIADEMVTGFKTHLPGSTIKYNLNPDLTTWGKGIANGYSFCALTGKRKYMELGGIKQKHSPRVFLISSTHGAETISLSAFIGTLKMFKKKLIIDKNRLFLSSLSKTCEYLIEKNDLQENIKIVKSNWILSFEFFLKNKVSFELKTLFLQEMIKNKVLFQGFFVPCLSHSYKELNLFRIAFKKSLRVVAQAKVIGVKKYLKGKIIKPVFTKYN
jgi:glutamate-1-semialdehyde aminotransferase